MAGATRNAGARRALRKQQHHPSTGIFHRGHRVGRRHLVGDPDAIPGRRVLRADGGVAALSPHVIACDKRGAIVQESPAKQSILSLRGEMDCFASLAMTIIVRCQAHTKEKRAERRASLSVQKNNPEKGKRRCYAACLCMAPDADADPRIALIERSIAPHSLEISAAARPSA